MAEILTATMMASLVWNSRVRIWNDLW